ncbi:MAG: hypothetical protein KA354_11505 [Phycisphaerae bacterium]|nr:hypothetical protein [Phycisphaerae bacterium]
METETILHVALFSGILGFFAFCASYAFHVWRNRNSANRQKSAPIPGARLFRWSILSISLGCVLLVVSLIWREVRPREGVLSGDGLYTVRAEGNLKLEYVTNARTVTTGDVLARFRSPERRAEIAELELKSQILDTQRKVVELQPLTPDNELVRHYEKCVADQRQLLASLTYLIPEHAVVIREKLRDRLDKTERINTLTTRIDDARRELQQAEARRVLADKHRVRMESLSGTGAAAEVEMDERSTDSTVQATEVSRLRSSIGNLETERTHLEQSLPAFAACASQQAEDIGRELARVREQLTASEKELSTSSARLEHDRKRAELLKAKMLAQLDLEVQQCEAKLEGVQDVLTIKAPFDGVVAYSDSAPATALPLAPVVIVTPEQGFRFRLRMAEAEIGPLARQDSVTLGLVAPVLQRRFDGRLIRWNKLAHEPGYVVAELACSPPPETIRDLVARDWAAHDGSTTPTVRIRLLWRPPLTVSPLFPPAVCMLAIGLIGLCAGGLRKTNRDDSREPSVDALEADSTPSGPLAPPPTELIVPLPAAELALDAAEVESGAVGRNLQLLGHRLRESIKRHCIEPSLLRALEWAIDRHHTRALRHLMIGLDHDPALPSSLERWQARAVSESEKIASEHDRPASRVIRIVEALAPELLGSGRSSRAIHHDASDSPTGYSMPSPIPQSSALPIQSGSR